MPVNDQDNLLRYYNDELTYLRRMGAHFGRRYSKIAGRLEQSEDSAADPHVQRLVESFAFLTARIQRQLDAEFSRITTTLLGVLYPHLVNPIPPMTIARFDVDPAQRKMTTGHLIPRDTALFAQTQDGLPCRFRTCYPVTLWPFEVESASFQSPDKLDFLNRHPQVATVLRLRLAPRGVSLAEMRTGLQSLRFFLRGDDVLVHALYELLFTRVWRVALLPQSKEPSRLAQNGPPPVLLPEDSIRPVGFGPEESVIPYPPHAHPAYRLLQEYFQFPQKFLFFDLANLDRHPSTEPDPDERLDILILLTEIPRQRLVIDRHTFALGCTPVVNLFPKTSEPVRLDHSQLEYRLIPDIRRERTHEIHTILSVSASSNPMEETARLDPFFSFQHRRDGKEPKAFWHARRAPTGREDLPGTDIYLGFLDLDLNPAQPPVQTVFAHTLCTNRDLTAQLQPRARLQIENAAPLTDISCLYKPTEPAYPPIEGASLWALISNLSLNYLSLSGRKESLDALREILRLYSFSDAPATHKQVQGIKRMAARRVVRRIRHDDWRGFCQGSEVTLEFEEDQYVGSGAFLLGAVLERFLALYSSLNSFTELVITRAAQPGREWKRWPPRAGYQPIL